MEFFNTATRAVESFRPLSPGRIGIYVCGPTVYGDAHLGHARSAVFYDVLVKFLRSLAFDVTHVSNITDIDDKIIQHACSRGILPGKLAVYYLNSFQDDRADLGVDRPDFSPRATEHIQEMIQWVKELFSKKIAYCSNESVYCDVKSFASYGTLSGRKLNSCSNIPCDEINIDKRSPADFVLWKASGPGHPGWMSPWGFGRPGWHLECAVMSTKYLGPSFDFHGGGSELLFPHHENERALAVALAGGTFARTWLHHGQVTVNGKKMSKSTGNSFRVKDILRDFSPEAVRFFLLNRQYRKPLDFSIEKLSAAQTSLIRLHHRLNRFERNSVETFSAPQTWTSSHSASARAFRDRFRGFMARDMNTSAAAALLFETVKNMEHQLMKKQASPVDGELSFCGELLTEALKAGRVLGIIHPHPTEFLERWDPLLASKNALYY